MSALGLLEPRHIPSGYLALDRMVKAAEVTVVKAHSICSGRFLIILQGETAAVSSAVEAGEGLLPERRIAGSFVIPGVGEEVARLLSLDGAPEEDDSAEGAAFGFAEFKSVASGIKGADDAGKRARVALKRFVMGQGINGKSWFLLSGETAAVSEALDTLATTMGEYLLDSSLIPAPDGQVSALFERSTAR